jgi:hypothetical protein
MIENQLVGQVTLLSGRHDYTERDLASVESLAGW